MSYNFTGDVKDQSKIFQAYLKSQHNTFDNHVPDNPFNSYSYIQDPSNIKVAKRFNFNQGIKEYTVDYLNNPYKNRTDIPYFRKEIAPFLSYSEEHGNTINYNNMVLKNGWND